VEEARIEKQDESEIPVVLPSLIPSGSSIC
jgi:hypothetical protein